MGASVELKEDGHVLYYSFSSPLTMDDLDLVIRQGVEYMDNSQQPLQVIVEASQLKNMPPGVLRHSNAPTLRHANTGSITIVGTTLLVQRLCQVIFKLANFQNVNFFDEEDDAWKYIREQIARGSTGSQS